MSQRILGSVVVLSLCAHVGTTGAQNCAPLASGRGDSAMAQALKVSLGGSRAGGFTPSGLRVVIRAVASRAPLLEVVVAAAGNLGHIVIMGLAGRDSICFSGYQGVGGGAFVSEDVVDRWNAGLARIAPSLTLGTPAAVRTLAAAVLTFASGYTVDSVATAGSAAFIAPDSSGLVGKATVNRVGDAYNVAGTLQSYIDRYLFFLRVDSRGRLVKMFIQNPPDPLISPQ